MAELAGSEITAADGNMMPGFTSSIRKFFCKMCRHFWPNCRHISTTRKRFYKICRYFQQNRLLIFLVRKRFYKTRQHFPRNGKHIF